ncbi:MAG: Ig-like domain-containing protein [Bacteroidales bacterium]|nr:Ig-like domain-containing protein [Bacteroidales bacterium]
MKRVLKAFAFAAAIVVALVSCKKEDQPKEVALTGIELNATTQTLQVGQEFQLTVTYKPENATSKPAATWASDAPAVATVDGGKVVAVAAGTAKITATVGTFTAECAITVASAEEEILPVEGNSAWSVIGALLGKSWDTDFVCAEENGAFVLKNVKLAKGNEIKFRKDKAWDVNRGINKENEAAELAAGTPTKAIQGGGNIIIPADGIYDLYYFAEKEAIVYVAKDATLPEIPNFAEETPTDFTSPDWASVVAVTEGNHTFKFTKDSEYAYFYTERPRDDRFNELWGDGKGYVYFAFDVDGDETNGETLNDNGPFDYIAFIYCFGGSADAPVIGINVDGGVAPGSYTLANVIAKGTVDDNGLKLEYRVPLADLPQFPEKFTVTSWGNKSLSKVVYPYPYEAPAAPAVATWTEAEAAGAIHFFQHRAGSGWNPTIYDNMEGDADAFDNLTVANGVYTVSYTEASDERWQSQFYMRPNPAKATLPLKAGKNYLVSLTFKANATFAAFAKLTQYGDAAPKHEGATLQEWANIPLEAGVEKTLAYVIEGVDCGNVNFTLDFGTHPENTTVEISNVKVEETDQPVGPIGDEPGVIDLDWDYTPSAEYLAESNLWKAVDGSKVGFFYHYPAAGFEAVTSDSYERLTFKESTYVLDMAKATGSTWENQLFIYPKEGSFIALDPAKTYKVKITVCSNADYYGPFIKLSTYNPDSANHEGAEMWALTGWPELINFKAGEPIVKETELTGKEAQNIIWIMGLGGNPANAKIYIKDIIVEEVKEQVTLTDLSTINALAANADFELNAIVAASIKISDSNSAAIVTDGTNCFYLFFNPASNNTYKVGDLVNAKGTISVYNHLIESAKNPTVTVLEEGVAVPEIAPKEITSFDTFLSTNQPTGLYTATGKYVIDNSYTNLVIDGSTAKGSLSDNIDEKWAGKTVKVTGWFTGANKSGNICYLRVTEIEEVAAAGIKIDGDLSDWADISELASTGTSRIRSWKFSSDDDNLYFYLVVRKNRMRTEYPVSIAIDVDESGSLSADNLSGAEFLAVFQPFTNPSSGTPTCVNGVISSAKINGEDATVSIKAYGVDPDASATGDSADYYLEVSIPRNTFTGFPAKGTEAKIGIGYEWYKTDYQAVTL